MNFLQALGSVCLVMGAVPLGYLTLLGAAALGLPRRKHTAPPARVAVLIPAHNEEGALGLLLNDLRRQTKAPEVRLVVAHNCSDRTEEIARAGGAEVLRVDGGNEKSDALQVGLAELAGREWDAVLVVDADCRVPEHFIAGCRLERTEIVQSRYVLGDAGEQSGIAYSYLARLEDAIFHVGRERCGFPALLRGTGMLLGRDALVRCPWVARGLTEDRSQTYAFLAAGIGARLEEAIWVTAPPPKHMKESWNQRRRWLSSGLPDQLRQAVRAARVGRGRLGLRVWELPLAVWADARSQWLLALVAGTALLWVAGGAYLWGLWVLLGSLAGALLLGFLWYRARFLRVLIELPRSVLLLTGAAILGLIGRRPAHWNRGR
jgi:glycosyltransferase involved in cell wall biosynthesis